MVYVAVLANINGNLPALAKALERIETLKEEGYEIKKYYVLGNVVGLFPYPREVIDTIDDLLRNNVVKVIRGEFDQVIAASDPHAEGPDYIDNLNYPHYIKKPSGTPGKNLDMRAGNL